MQHNMSNTNTTTSSWISNNENLPVFFTDATELNDRNNVSSESTKPEKTKRKQVKNACVNCQKACKKCDDGRPCKRCIKLGLTTTCRNSDRKERKKGVKRGPYKKRQGTTKDKPVYPKLTDEWALESTLYNQLPVSIQALDHQNTWSPSVSPVSLNSYYDLDEDSFYLATQSTSNSFNQPSLSPISSGFESEETLHYSHSLGYTSQEQPLNASISYSPAMLDHQPITGNIVTSNLESYSWDAPHTRVNSVKGATPIGYGPATFPSQPIPQYISENYADITTNTDFKKILPSKQFSQLQEIGHLQSNITTFWDTPTYSQYQPYYYENTIISEHS